MHSTQAQPKYLAIYHELLKLATTSQSGDKLPSFAQLKKQFSVSLATLNSALDLLEQDGRIKRKPKQGIYFSSPTESESIQKRKITLAIPGDKDPLFVTIITAVHNFFHRHGIELSLGLYELTPHSETSLLHRLADDGTCSGVLFLPLPPRLFDSHDSLKALRELARTKPVVQFDRQLGKGITPFVGYQCYDASYQATQHLINCGHTNIGLIKASNDDLKHPSDRISGFQHALKDAGLKLNLRNVIVYDVFNPDLSNDVVEILSSPHCPTAFYAVNSVYLPRLIRKALFVNKRIPKDISLITFDLTDTFKNLPLAVTHISQQTELVVNRASELLLRKMNGEELPNESHTVPNVFVDGETCRTLTAGGVPSPPSSESKCSSF